MAASNSCRWDTKQKQCYLTAKMDVTSAYFGYVGKNSLSFMREFAITVAVEKQTSLQ